MLRASLADGRVRGFCQLWAVIYPIDMIKSRMQTDGFSPATGQKYKSAVHCLRTVWRTEGLPAFTRGLIPTLIRYVYNLLLADVVANTSLVHPSQTARHSWVMSLRLAPLVKYRDSHTDHRIYKTKGA